MYDHATRTCAYFARGPWMGWKRTNMLAIDGQSVRAHAGVLLASRDYWNLTRVGVVLEQVGQPPNLLLPKLNGKGFI